MKVGVTRVLPLDSLKLLQPFFESVEMYDIGRPLSEEELCEAIKGKDVFIVQLTEPLTEKVMSHADRLKHVATFSTGVDHLNLTELKKRGIRLSHTPGVLTEATANLTWALILNCARKIKPAEAFLREGKFNGFLPSLFLGLSLERATLGIVGMGKIGLAVANRARAFGMNVIYYSRGSKEIPWAKRVDFKELVQTSDVVSLHCPLTEDTFHLFNSEVLGWMKPDGILVNTSRGPVVDEKALLKHLQANPEFCAGLDVFEDEPAVTPGLLDLDNAVCVPHIGSASRWAREQMAKICIEEAMRFARGEILQYEYPL